MKIALFLVLIFLTGCVSPLKPGRSQFKAPDVSGSVQQSENPQQQTTQIYEHVEEDVQATQENPSGVPASQVRPRRVTERVVTTIGAAQKDTAREIGAKLASLKGVVWVGVLVFLFGAASMFYPPLKLIVGSTTTSAAACAAGLALIFLPSLIVGHEILILCVGVGAVGIWWFAHRHGHLRGQLTELLKK